MHKIDCTIITSCEDKRNVYQNSKEYGNPAIRLAKSIRQNGGSFKDCPIIMWFGEDRPPLKHIEKTLRELQLREDEVMLKYQNRLNQHRASRTIKEWYKDNEEIIAEKKKEYREKNKEHIAEHRKEKIKCNICGCESTRGHLARHKKTKKCQSHLTNS